MSNIIHPDEAVKPEPETRAPLIESEEYEAGGNPTHSKCPKCGDIPLHYALHVKSCRGKQSLANQCPRSTADPSAA